MTAIIPRPRYRNRALRRNMGNPWDQFLLDPDLFGQMEEGPWFPAADINDNDKEVIVTAELPGLNPEDVDIKASGDMLTIRGEKKSEEEDDNHYERYFGSFERSFRLPSEVSSEKAEATYKNGVLKIKLPKSESESRKAIKIMTQ
jgi:HSP20 family protein